METLFVPEKANLSGIPFFKTPPQGFLPLYVTEFLQSAQLNINERGVFGDNNAILGMRIEVKVHPPSLVN